MFPIPDKYEDLDLQQKEYFAELGFRMYQIIVTDTKIRLSKEAEKLCQTVCQNQDDIFNSLQSMAVKFNNALDELKHKVK